MEQMDLIVRNGVVVLPTGVEQVDIGIKDGKIKVITSELAASARQEWNAAGQVVMPGMIDVHVHFSEPGREHWEGFSTGSSMMAAGGCTTFFDMPLNGIPSTVNCEALLDKARLGNKKSVVDFGLWGGLVPGNEDDLAPLAKSGVIGFKAFLSTTGNKEFEAVDEMTLLSGMKQIAKLGKVLALHAESAAITNWLKAEKEQAGCVSADDYLATRPILAEVEAVERALYYAEITGCALHFVHISSEAAVGKIEDAKSRGMNVTVETCAHYLLFNHDALRERGSIAKCAPPLREASEQKKLIELVAAGKFDMLTSDHSPCPYDMKDPKDFNLFQAWGGISGGQFTLLAALELSQTNHIPLEQIARMTASAPAERFDLADRKGKIAVGMDADLAIIDLDTPFTVTEDNYYAKHKQSLYMGHTFPSSIVGTIVRGKVVVQDGRVLENEGIGKNGQWQKPEGTQLVDLMG
ncbi:allantoinase [Paenibacillus agri]|uniref:Allantoinase n=1 Tax=Paenibacillus agri TaxID=2744309 RepID=A0A850ENE0_9BACL|nr:allantoinase [Paenibacillus agri]NUU60102.1 allantoinase [Paenibacillus agri]